MGAPRRCSWPLWPLAIGGAARSARFLLCALALLCLPSGLRGQVDLSPAGGEAWPLTTLADGGRAVPLLVKVSTSSKPAYEELHADLGLQLRLNDNSALRFEESRVSCMDIIIEVKSMPAPKSCETTSSGHRLTITFYRDDALRPATSYFFILKIMLLAPGASVRSRTVFVETFEEHLSIDTFGFVLPPLVPAVPGPLLRMFEVASETPTLLQNQENFVVRVTLAATSDENAVDAGLRESVIIWPQPLTLWDFSMVQPCIVEISAEAGTGSGTCRFIRFPPAESPEVQASFGLNAIELTPTETVGYAPIHFRVRVVAPRGGSLAVQHPWMVQAKRAGAASQMPLDASFGIPVRLAPQATFRYASNVAADAANRVVITFTPGVTFHSYGFVTIVVPEAFAVQTAEVFVLGFSRLGSGGSAGGTTFYADGHTVVMDLPQLGSVFGGTTYAVALTVRNPSTSVLPAVCVDTLQALMSDDSRLGSLSLTRFSIAEPTPWSFELSVGLPVQQSQFINFQAYNVLPSLRGAFISPSHYGAGILRNTLTVLFRLSLGLLTTDASVHLAGPEEFQFLCVTLVAPTQRHTRFPEVQDCRTVPGLLMLDLAPGTFHPYDLPLSFAVDVRNPSEEAALLLERKVRIATDPGALPLQELHDHLNSRTSWALFVNARNVPCQAQVQLQSPYGIQAWGVYRSPLYLDSVTTTVVEARRTGFVNMRYRFTSTLPRNSHVIFYAPNGFQFSDFFDVEAESTGAVATLPVSLGSVAPTIGRSHEVMVPLAGSTRVLTTYGFRAAVVNAQVAPETQEDPVPNVWSILAVLPEDLMAADGLNGRVNAGSREGFDLSTLQGCEVRPGNNAYGRSNEVLISFVVHQSLFTTTTSTGSIRITAPSGYFFQENCEVQAPRPTLEPAHGTDRDTGFMFFRTRSCLGADNMATIQVDRSSAIVRGSHVRFRVSVLNPTSDPLNNRWEIETRQGFMKLEECESAIRGFELLRSLDRAYYQTGSAGEDLRPGLLSVYRITFMHPRWTQDEAVAISSGVKTFSTIVITAPEGFRAPAACLNGASGSSGLDGVVQALPPLISCVGVDRTATFTIAGLIEPETLYSLSVSMVNPPNSFAYSPTQATWILRVDDAIEGSIEPPPIRLLRDVQLLPGDPRERSALQWVKILFRTASIVPQRGGVNVLVPGVFTVEDCSSSSEAWFLLDADHDVLGDMPAAPGTVCQVIPAVLSGQKHQFMLFPLTQGLLVDNRYLVALRVHNVDHSTHAADTEGWSVYTTDHDGETLDMSNEIDSYEVRRDFGQVTFTPPALAAAPGTFYSVQVHFSLRTTVRSGAAIFYPPPKVQVACQEPDAETLLPRQLTCSVEGSWSEWQSQRLVLNSPSFTWSSNRPYIFRMQVYELGHPLPAYRNAWMMALIAAIPGDATSLSGFNVGTRSIEQWRWRGMLQSLAVSNDNPAINRRYPTYIEFITVQPFIALQTELWVRGPPMVVLHEFSCRSISMPGVTALARDRRLIPIQCSMPPTTGTACSPHVWETEPCEDTAPDLATDSLGFAHRRGLRVAFDDIDVGVFVRLAIDTTPIALVLEGAGELSNVWTVSHWIGNVEQDVAQVSGYAIRNWIDVTRWVPSTLVPEADVDITVEWWTLAPLPAGGRVFIEPPTYGVPLFDLSFAATRFNPGNLPQIPPSRETNHLPVPPTVVALSARLEIILCCQLDVKTAYHITFGTRNPKFRELPAPSLSELNKWSILTREPEPSQTVLHQQVIQGHRLKRDFQQASITYHTERSIGGVATSDIEGQIQVAVDFLLPFATALHGPSLEIRLLAPQGYEFPGTCVVEGLRFGPWTSIGNCRATERELVMALEGSVNPGIESQEFGFIIAIQPPFSTSSNDIWVLQALPPTGSPESLNDPGLENRIPGTELELRLSSMMMGLVRPSAEGPYDPSPVGVSREMVAWVELTPRAPYSYWTSWRRPQTLRVAVRFMLPETLPAGMSNTTLRVSGPHDAGQLRCTELLLGGQTRSKAASPFQAGTLPPGILCYDYDNSQDISLLAEGVRVRVTTQTDIILSVDNLIPLHAGTTYEFFVHLHTPTVDYARSPTMKQWPRDTSWRLTLTAGGDQFRIVAAEAPNSEGMAQAPNAIRDLGLLTNTTKGNILTEVTLLFATDDDLPLPLSIEVEPPPHFRLDSAPSPLHPALQPDRVSVNPFRSVGWQERVVLEAEEAARRVATGEELVGEPCPFFHLMVNSPERQPVAVDHDFEPEDSFCRHPPTADPTVLETCKADAYNSLDALQTRCTVLSHKVVIRLYSRRLNSYADAFDRDRQDCTRFECERRFTRPVLPKGFHRLSVRGYNAPETPENVADNIWTLTLTREIRALGAGPRSTVEPLLSAEVPGYLIGEGSAMGYADRISPMGAEPIKGGSEWQDLDERIVPSVTVLDHDVLIDGRVLELGAAPVRRAPTPSVPPSPSEPGASTTTATSTATTLTTTVTTETTTVTAPG